MKHQRNPKKALKVTFTFSGSDVPNIRRPRQVVPSVNVAAIRAKTGMSQSAFAASIGVPEGTLVNWEQGRRTPTGPAQVLLAIIAKKPSLVQELFAKRHLNQKQRENRRSPDGPHPDEMTPEARMAEVGKIIGFGLARLLRKQAFEQAES
jgi:putative transcriptional regulator